MEGLSNEVIFLILRGLTVRDCVRFASTCRRFHNLLSELPSLLPSFNCQTLHLRDKSDLSYAAFLVRHGLSEGVERIKLNIYLCEDDVDPDSRSYSTYALLA